MHKSTSMHTYISRLRSPLLEAGRGSHPLPVVAEKAMHLAVGAGLEKEEERPAVAVAVVEAGPHEEMEVEVEEAAVVTHLEVIAEVEEEGVEEVVVDTLPEGAEGVVEEGVKLSGNLLRNYLSSLSNREPKII